MTAPATPLVADTSGLLRALARRPEGGPAWPAFEAALVSASAIVVPSLVLAEVDYFLRSERRAMRRLVAEMLDPSTRYELEPLQPHDLARALEIDVKFADLELGLVDGLVAAVAERRKIHRVLTIDHADLAAVRIGTLYRTALTLLP